MAYDPVPSNPFTIPGSAAGLADFRKKASANGGTPGPVVTVAVPAYTASAPAPTISGASPNNAAVGTAVTLTGTNFTGATAVAFNGTAATFTVLNATTINTSVPTGATTGLVTVTTPGGTASSTGSFTVTTAAPSNLPINLIVVGDSIQAYTPSATGANGSAGTTAPGQFAAARISAPAVTLTRLGYPGESVTEWNNLHRAAFDAAVAPTTTKRNIAVFAYGANDINQRPIAQIEADYLSAIAYAKSKGCEVVVMPVMNRTDGFGYTFNPSGAHDPFNPTRLSLNTWIVNNAAANGYTAAPASASPDMYADAYASDGSLEYDGVHPTSKGTLHQGEGTMAEGIALLGGITLAARTADAATPPPAPASPHGTPAGFTSNGNVSVSGNRITTLATAGNFSGIANSNQKLSGLGVMNWVPVNQGNGNLVGICRSRTATGPFAELDVAVYYDGAFAFNRYAAGAMLPPADTLNPATGADFRFTLTAHPTDATKYQCQISANGVNRGGLIDIPAGQYFLSTALQSSTPDTQVEGYYVSGALVPNP